MTCEHIKKDLIITKYITGFNKMVVSHGKLEFIFVTN